MDERARKILDDAFATCERVDKMLNNMPERQPYDPYVPPEREAVVHRTRGLDTTPEQRRQLRQQEDEANIQGWNRWFDMRHAEALSKFSEEYSKHVVQLMFKRMDDHKHELEDQIQELRTEITLLRETRSGNVRELTRKSDVG